MKIRHYASALAMLAGLATSHGASAESGKGYVQTNLVANQESYQAARVEQKLTNAWGIAIRPKGAGGHFWITGGDTSFEYVGDVHNSPDESLRNLRLDKLQYVHVPVTGDDKFTTGVSFVDSKSAFVITQTVEGAEPITAPAKFLFSGDSGLITAWTERKKDDGSFDRPGDAITVIDEAAAGAQFFGLALNAANDRIYAANFGENPGIRVYDASFKPADITFDLPFDKNRNGAFDAGEYAPFNVQALITPSGEHHIFVSYAKTQLCNAEGLVKKECEKGKLFAGEEDTEKPGHGRLAEFTEDGKLVAVWPDRGHLSAPWGMAFAPQGFGALSGKFLVGNFGDGSIAAFDPATRKFIDVLRDPKGKPIKIEKIWGLLFGNGESLGDSNALYFTAGPNDEKDGLFGSLRVSE